VIKNKSIDCTFASICLPTKRCGCITNNNCIDGGICINNICIGPTPQIQSDIIFYYFFNIFKDHIVMSIVAEYTISLNTP